MPASPSLNENAHRLADQIAAEANALRIGIHTIGGVRVLDGGIASPGGLHAGLGFARVCLAGLGEVILVPGAVDGVPCHQLQVVSDRPVLACMASQYAGWKVSVGKFFAMGSGPMRAALGTEEIFDRIPGREQATVAVGVLESRALPDEAVIAALAGQLRIPTEKLTLLVAPAASLAGTVQVVARSLETALHKLYELKFDLNQVVSGTGWAPLPPVAVDEIRAIGRTNDAILYGGQVTLWVRCTDEQLRELGPKVPSSSSPDHGAPFADIFRHANHDFYKIDPLLFSPAQVVFNNLATGRCFVFGRLEPAVLRRSFYE